MKRMVLGITFMLSGVILHVTAMLVCSNYVPYITEWNSKQGKFFEAVNELKMTNYLIASAILFFVGAAWCLFSLKERTKEKTDY